MENYIKETIDNLKKNGMEVYFEEDKSAALDRVRALLTKGASVAVGGSVTLTEIGALDLLRSGDYEFFDRYNAKNDEETKYCFNKGFEADYFLSSSNAITKNGELYNVDGNGNRIAPLIYGPKEVIIVAGINKIVADFKEAVLRVKTVAAPLNAKRLNMDTYCKNAGICAVVDGINPSSGCGSNCRICRDYLLLGPQRVSGRIKVILVNENLGY